MDRQIIKEQISCVVKLFNQVQNMNLRMTNIDYTPTVAHNIKGWNTIERVFKERGEVVSHLVLMGQIKDHPTPGTNKTDNALKFIDWHVKHGRLEVVE